MYQDKLGKSKLCHFSLMPSQEINRNFFRIKYYQCLIKDFTFRGHSVPVNNFLGGISVFWGIHCVFAKTCEK